MSWDAFCPITRQLIKQNRYKNRVYVGIKVSRGNGAIACRHLRCPSEDLRRWMGPLCSNDPSAMTSSCCYRDGVTRCKRELTRSALRCVSAAPWEQSEDRSNNGPPSQIWTPLWERISEAPGKAGGCEEGLDCSLWWMGIMGVRHASCSLFFLLQRSSPTS